MRYRKPQEKKEFAQKIIDLARVTRVTKGGKRLRFRACVAVGDGKGRVGVGVAKGADVAIAVGKASKRAEKDMINVPLVNETIPHSILIKEGAARLFLKPAPKGTGVRAGGAVRVVLKLAGVPNVVSKIFGSRNKINNVRAVLRAFQSFRLSSAAMKKQRTKTEVKAIGESGEKSKQSTKVKKIKKIADK